MLMIAIASAACAEEAAGTNEDFRQAHKRRSLMIQSFTSNGWPPLFQAVRGGQIETVKTLLKEGAKTDLAGSWKHTILHIAAASGLQHPETAPRIFRILVEAGADINATTSSRVTPLHEATLSGSTAIVDLLLEKGANVNAQVKGTIHCIDPDKDLTSSSAFCNSGEFRTALDFASAIKHAELIALLRKHGGKTESELIAESNAGKAATVR